MNDEGPPEHVTGPVPRATSTTRRLDLDAIPIFVEGTLNVFKHFGVIPGAIGRTAADTNVYIGKTAMLVLTARGGFGLRWPLFDRGHALKAFNNYRRRYVGSHQETI